MTKEITFNDLNLAPELLKALKNKNYTIPTPIQLKSIPSLLEGKDLIGIAQTGTGKTAAFTLPILQRMTEKYPRKLRTLILAPTRELAAQIGESIETYGKFLKFKHAVIFGGVSQHPQVSALSKGVDIVVATPGRLMDLISQRKLNLRDIEFFVLDEADRMLDMGFIRDIKKVIALLPKNKQSLFFSATMSPEINTLAKKLLHEPVHVEITPQATTVEKIKQHIYFVDGKEKLPLLRDIFESHDMGSVLIFTRTKHRANKVAKFLNDNKIHADAIHGNKSQNLRTRAIKNFKSGEIQVLVATDIAARGIDIPNISHVINFELPNEPESYVHRIGRTARAGSEGTAYSFCEAEERNYLRFIEKLTNQTIDIKKHKNHSKHAQTATGADAKPPPKVQRGRNLTPRKDKGQGGRRNSRGRSSDNDNPRGKVKSYSNKNKSAGNKTKSFGEKKSYGGKKKTEGSKTFGSKKKSSGKRW